MKKNKLYKKLMKTQDTRFSKASSKLKRHGIKLTKFSIITNQVVITYTQAKME